MSNRLHLTDYNEYLKFKRWIKNIKIKFHTGASYVPREDVFVCKKSEFHSLNIGVMVMKTPSFIFHWLYKNCPFDFVKKAILEEYDEEDFEIKPFDRTEIGTSFDISPSILIEHIEKGKKIWQIKSDGWLYDDDFDNWAHESEHLPNDTDSFICESLKELEIKISSIWNLPKGLQFELVERYGSNKYILTIK